MRKYGWILACIAFVLLMVPFYLGITGAHPATDDFTFAAYTRPTFVRTGSILHVIKDAVPVVPSGCPVYSTKCKGE